MRMARAAGVKAIGVAWGYHAVVELEAAGADIIVQRFDRLEAAIDGLLGE
jgi:phosphoglycolate phosphatase